MRVGIDIMGSDSSPITFFDAVLKAAQETPLSFTFVVFATQNHIDVISKLHQKAIASLPRAKISFHVCKEFIEMHDEPLSALRIKNQASILLAVESLQRSEIDALISAGNTGALVAAASLRLTTLAGIARPALLATLPSFRGTLIVADVGGTLSRKSHYLLQSAYMGIACSHILYKTPIPSVGLLNIGSEPNKGCRELQKAYSELSKLSSFSPQEETPNIFNFIGNIEAREIFHSNLDVLVTDGFTGNILLKTIEGTSAFALESLQSLCARTRVSSTLANEIDLLQKRLSYTEYSGGILCGIDGIIIKCHGCSSSKEVYHSIKKAFSLISENFIFHLKNTFTKFQRISDKNPKSRPTC